MTSPGPWSVDAQSSLPRMVPLPGTTGPTQAHFDGVRERLQDLSNDLVELTGASYTYLTLAINEVPHDRWAALPGVAKSRGSFVWKSLADTSRPYVYIKAYCADGPRCPNFKPSLETERES